MGSSIIFRAFRALDAALNIKRLSATDIACMGYYSLIKQNGLEYAHVHFTVWSFLQILSQTPQRVMFRNLWNQLPNDLKVIASPNSFKSKLKFILATSYN